MTALLDRPPLDPGIAAYLEQAAGEPRSWQLTPAGARERLRRRRGGGGPPVGAVEHLILAGPGGDLPGRVYRPGGADLAAVYLHSGGWVTGDLETSDGVARRLARAAGADLLSLEYRLAPEHPFPAALEDARAAIRWAAEDLVRGRPLVVVGESAGGCLAAVCAGGWDGTGVPVAAQLLIYPVTDCDLDRPSYRATAPTYPLRREEMSWYWDNYLPDPLRREDPEASPLRAPDLSRAAPAVVALAAHDPLIEEGRAYGERLAAAGVPVRSLEYGSATHGFLGIRGEMPLRDRAVAEMCEALRGLALEDEPLRQRDRRSE